MSIDEVGQKWAEEKQRNHPQAKRQDQDEAQAGVRIPRRDAERRVGLDEADPVEGYIRSKVDRPRQWPCGRQRSPGRPPLSIASPAPI